MSKTTINISDPESGVPDLTLTIDGMVGATGEEFAGALIDLARQAHASAFTGSFDEQIVDMFLFKFEKRQEEEAKPSEFDLGWTAGYDAGHDLTSQVGEGTPAYKVGDKVRIIHTWYEANPRHGFAVDGIVTLYERPNPDYYKRPRKDGEEKYDEAWQAKREGGLMQWVHPDDFEPVTDEG